MPRPARRIPAPRAMIVAPQPEAGGGRRRRARRRRQWLDAVLACAFTQGVVDPMMCGIAGLGVLMLHDPRTGRQVVFDGLAPCPAAAHESMWSNLFERECSDGYGFVLRGAVNEMGRTAVTVPAILRIFADAHAEHGRTPWGELFGGAIDCARRGWMVRPHVHTMMAMDESAYGRVSTAEKLKLTEDAARLYLRADGTPRRPGEMVVNPDLAATLETIARDGADAFYAGEIARRIAADMAAHGGLITEADLAAVRSRRVAPLRVAHAGREIVLPPPPAGGIFVGEMLRILAHFDLPAMGHNSAAAIRVLAEAMKIAGLDKDAHVGDPDFVEVPVDRLLGDAHTAAAAERIRRGERASLVRRAPSRRAPHHLLRRCRRHGGERDAYARRALRRRGAGARLHAERGDELVRSAARPRHLYAPASGATPLMSRCWSWKAAGRSRRRPHPAAPGSAWRSPRCW